MKRNTNDSSPHVVIVGGGFAGLNAVKGLKRAKARLTLIDRSNYHLFQPLLYQVATAGLSPADIATPIRNIVRHQENTEVLMGEVRDVDVQNRSLNIADGRTLTYDYLVLATGARHGYFGHGGWEQFAPGLKSIEDATQIRRKILLAFEAAESTADRALHQKYLTFILVGGGPTGVEMAGAIAELARKALASDFRHINPQDARVLLIEAGPRLLATFPEVLSAKAAADLKRLGVDVRCNTKVESVDADGVEVSVGGARQRLDAKTVLWAAGVVASPVAAWLQETGIEADRAGRVKVNADLSVPGHPEIFVIGDVAWVPTEDGATVPGVAPAAMQQGSYVAKALQRRFQGEAVPAFRYINKGNLATIGRSSAIADLGFLRLSGWIAWCFWLGLHIFYLIGFRNRLLVLIQWAWAYVTFQRGARLITPVLRPDERL